MSSGGQHGPQLRTIVLGILWFKNFRENYLPFYHYYTCCSSLPYLSFHLSTLVFIFVSRHTLPFVSRHTLVLTFTLEHKSYSLLVVLQTCNSVTATCDPQYISGLIIYCFWLCPSSLYLLIPSARPVASYQSLSFTFLYKRQLK